MKLMWGFFYAIETEEGKWHNVWVCYRYCCCFVSPIASLLPPTSCSTDNAVCMLMKKRFNRMKFTSFFLSSKYNFLPNQMCIYVSYCLSKLGVRRYCGLGFSLYNLPCSQCMFVRSVHVHIHIIHEYCIKFWIWMQESRIYLQHHRI